MGAKSFVIEVSALNYAFPPKPFMQELHCNLAVPMGVTWVTAYNQCEEIERKKLFLIRYNEQTIYGTLQFASFEEYYQFINENCATCKPPFCGLTIDGCLLTIDGCSLEVE